MIDQVLIKPYCLREILWNLLRPTLGQQLSLDRDHTVHLLLGSKKRKKEKKKNNLSCSVICITMKSLKIGVSYEKAQHYCILIGTLTWQVF